MLRRAPQPMKESTGADLREPATVPGFQLRQLFQETLDPRVTALVQVDNVVESERALLMRIEWLSSSAHDSPAISNEIRACSSELSRIASGGEKYLRERMELEFVFENLGGETAYPESTIALAVRQVLYATHHDGVSIIQSISRAEDLGKAERKLLQDALLQYETDHSDEREKTLRQTLEEQLSSEKLRRNS